MEKPIWYSALFANSFLTAVGTNLNSYVLEDVVVNSIELA